MSNGNRGRLSADLGGMTAIVTGGASGIGLATVQRFASLGARVALNHLPDDAAGQEQVEKLRAEGFDVISAPGDVSKAGLAEDMVCTAIAELGRLDVLVNNAGTPATREPIPFHDLDSLDEDRWEKILQTNLMGTFRCAHAAAEALKATKGVIVNVASVAGIGGSGSSIAYAASKAAIVNMTRNLAKGLAPVVRVNAVAPGFVLSPWTASWSEERHHNTIAATWLGRGAAPSEIAEAILFLSAGPKFVNAHTLVIDGGR